MISQTDKKANNNRPIDHVFENVKQWMTDEEVEMFSREENHFGVFLTMILHRHQAIRKNIRTLAEIADNEWEERLLRIDESIQVYHFFYQSLLCEFSNDHKKYVEVLNILVKKLKE